MVLLRYRRHPTMARGAVAALLASVLLVGGGTLAADEAALGQRAYQEGRHAEAADLFEKALAKGRDDRSGPLLLALGNCRAELRQWEAAIAAYREAVALKAGSADVHRSIGQAQLKLDRLDDALASFARAAALDAEGPYEVWMARILLQRGDWEPAEQALLHHLRSHADSIEGRELLASVLLRQGRDAEAARTYRALVLRKPLEAGYRLGLAQAEASAKRYGEALDALEAAERLGCASEEGLRLLADLYLKEQMPREAAAAYGRLLAAFPASRAEDRRRLAHAHLLAGDVPAARAAFEQTLAFDPTCADAALQLAQLADRGDRPKQARALFAEAMAAAPRDATAAALLGRFELGTGRWGEAAAALAEAVRRGDRDACNFHDRALALSKAGDRDGAWETLKEGLREHPFDERLRALLGEWAR
ncbi:MAG: tetratricopeptide repeat protein [Planctomycetes bacterium]|nr:tetratricopeptide repeat protein [Planctomycetota bacterium]